ncbi:MAG TPA: glucosamine-6-phosphate deaminase [Cytophagaceae bacterium]|jgi:glucosamine-6-phosphate deaminase|nr:glucosamine-6-phosphate deaminase [Cytophagaceae bacterium]
MENKSLRTISTKTTGQEILPAYEMYEAEASKKFERISTEVLPHPNLASKIVAKEIAQLIQKKQKEGEYCVLGLATGSTPKLVYKELVRLHKEEGVSFRNVIAFNLDEYYPMKPDALQSYVRFMKEHLFDHVDIDPSNYHIPDGTVPNDMLSAYCKDYERKIEDAGGIDLQLLGIGSTGHIGFNESGSLINTKTRLITLDHSTRIAAAGDFFGLGNVPKKAITMGVRTILHARRIIIMAWGDGKSGVVQKAVEGPITEHVPASFLQNHQNTTFFVDQAASAQLTRMKTPWLVGTCKWDNKLIKKAVTSLALQLNKPILMLTDRDYNDNGMSDLLAAHGSAYDINLDVFNQLQHTITGWPGGKPGADDSQRPERALPSRKKVLIFSPHPDDDIISMGGTFIRLQEQGHDVHVAYQTSGNIAVSDDDALRFAEFVKEFNEEFGIDDNKSSRLFKEAVGFIRNKKQSEKDTDEIRKIKGFIRQTEAKATCRFVGIPEANMHFMNLPFYETGLTQKKPLGDEDIKLTIDLLEQIQPHQVFAAGDLADPHGTHKVCLDAVLAAMSKLKTKEWTKDCWFWLYSGAWAEFDIHEIEMAVPLSPDQVIQKRNGIFKHQSQKDGVVFQGSDSREFWQRAEERNRGTAELYNKLGLAQYAAIEGFVKHKFSDL